MILNPAVDVSYTVEPMAELLTRLTCDLLGSHGPTSLEVRDVGECSRFILSVSPEDLERLSGPQGRTAASLRVIVRAAGIRQGRNFELMIDRSAARAVCAADTGALDTRSDVAG